MEANLDTFDLLEKFEKVVNGHIIPNLVCNTSDVEILRHIFTPCLKVEFRNIKCQNFFRAISRDVANIESEKN